MEVLGLPDKDFVNRTSRHPFRVLCRHSIHFDPHPGARPQAGFPQWPMTIRSMPTARPLVTSLQRTSGTYMPRPFSALAFPPSRWPNSSREPSPLTRPLRHVFPRRPQCQRRSTMGCGPCCICAWPTSDLRWLWQHRICFGSHTAHTCSTPESGIDAGVGFLCLPARICDPGQCPCAQCAPPLLGRNPHQCYSQEERWHCTQGGCQGSYWCVQGHHRG